MLCIVKHFTWIVIVVVFFLLDKGHKSENLQKDFLKYFLMLLFNAKVNQNVDVRQTNGQTDNIDS